MPKALDGIYGTRSIRFIREIKTLVSYGEALYSRETPMAPKKLH